MKKITTVLITLLFNSIIMAQLPSNSFFEYEFSGGSLNNTSSSGAPNFTGSITSIADRNASANDAADITGVLSGAAVGASNVSEMTLTFWMKHAPLTSNQRIIQIYGIGGKGFKLEMNGSQLFCYATIGGNNASYITTSHSSVVVIDNSAWHHIAIRTALTNAATIEYDIFVDNVPVPNLSNQTLDIENYQNGLSITNFLSSATLVVSPTNNYSGDIDDIYFYKSALTDAEITQIYNYSPPPCTVNIPDANFKAYLVGNAAINTNGNTEIECTEASAFTGIINCSNLSIADVTGIEMFPNLTYLLCPDNQLTSIDITNNTALIGLNCSTNSLAGLDVSSNASLVDLYCNTSTLTTLDVTNNPSLTHLECKTNSLTSLDISSNPNLNVLKCSSNSLTSLDVSNNTAMTHLESNFNMIQNLDISNNVALTIFTCNSNSLTSLNAANGNNSSLFFIASSNPNLTCITVDNVAYSTTNWTNVDAQTSFSLNCNPPCTVAIPDANFKAYLVGNAAINTNGNTEIECSEATAFTGIINCANQSISDLTGIEAFSNITSLYCNHNSLSTINLTQNTSLVLLQCNNNSINSLDVTQNIALNELICHSNLLINLDLTQNTLLTNINCSINLINNLILDQNLVLVNLYCDNNTITNLDLSQNTALSFLKCHTNSLTTLNVSNGNNSNIPTGNFYTYNNPNLTCITVDNVAYSSANWTSIDAQTSFSTNCAIAPCTVAIPDVNFKAYLVGNLAINTNGNAEIECSEASAFTGIINCNSQSIADLTGIEAFPLLTTLYCYANSLTALDVSNNTNLTTLYCNANNLTVLDLSNNTALNKIYCDNNSLAALDVSNNTALTSLRSNNNSFTTLNVANGNNTNFIFFDATVNPSLTCITVDNVAYSTTNWTSIDAASSFNTNCSGTVGIEELSNESLSVYPNPVKNQLFIELNEQITEMVILDYSGRIVKSIRNNANSINVSDLNQGIYILKVTTKNGVLTNRFIKQ